MYRNVALIAVILLALSMVTASGPAQSRNESVAILPEDCLVLVGEDLLLEIEGSLPPNTVVTWSTDYGGVASTLPGLSAVLIAPDLPGVITVVATISFAEAGWEALITRQCIVILQDDILY